MSSLTALIFALLLFAALIAGLVYYIKILQHKVTTQLKALDEREQQLALVTDNMTDWVWKIDANNCYSYVSPSVSKLLGYSPDDLLGKRMEVVLHPAEQERAQAEYRHVIASAKREGLSGCRDSIAHYGLRHKNGDLIWTEAAVRMLFTAESEFAGAQGSSRDISDRRQNEDMLRQMQFNDALTQLPNRRRLNDLIQKTLSGCHRHHQYAALLLIDMDHFKYINDNYGHDSGDMLLQQIARRLAGNLRASEKLARFCGDEFVLIAEQLGQDLEGAKHNALLTGIKLLESLEREFVLPDIRCKLSASIGIILFNNNNRTVPALLKLADSAMYQAKTSGRNRCVISETNITV